MNSSITLEKYMDKTLRLWLGIRSDDKIRMPELPEYLMSLFLQEEEIQNHHRDQWGLWEHSFSSNYINGTLWTPEIDEWLIVQRNKISKDGIKLLPLWPDNKRFALCLTHDIDTIDNRNSLIQQLRRIVQIKGIRSYSIPQKFKKFLSVLISLMQVRQYSMLPDTSSTLEAMIEIEKEMGVFSSLLFFTFPEDQISEYDCMYSINDTCRFRNKRIKVYEMIKWLNEEGFDIGLHGSYNTATNKTLMIKQKQSMESILGFPIASTRQHWLNWDILKTPMIQSDAGILVDSSAGYNRNVGFRKGTGLPHYHYDHVDKCELPLLEIPLVINDGALFGNNALEYNNDLSKRIIMKILERIIIVQGCITSIFHPYFFYLENYKEIYRWLIEYCLERGAWVTSLNEINVWWRKREKELGF